MILFLWDNKYSINLFFIWNITSLCKTGTFIWEIVKDLRREFSLIIQILDESNENENLFLIRLWAQKWLNFLLKANKILFKITIKIMKKSKIH